MLPLGAVGIMSPPPAVAIMFVCPPAKSGDTGMAKGEGDEMRCRGDDSGCDCADRAALIGDSGNSLVLSFLSMVSGRTIAALSVGQRRGAGRQPRSLYKTTNALSGHRRWAPALLDILRQT